MKKSMFLVVLMTVITSFAFAAVEEAPFSDTAGEQFVIAFYKGDETYIRHFIKTYCVPWEDKAVDQMVEISKKHKAEFVNGEGQIIGGTTLLYLANVKRDGFPMVGEFGFYMDEDTGKLTMIGYSDLNPDKYKQPKTNPQKHRHHDNPAYRPQRIGLR